MLLNLLRNIENNARITGIILICIITAFILIPKMTEVTTTFHSLIVNGISDTESSSFTTNDMNSGDENRYIPPNYGAPDSQYGSGTR